MKKRSITRTVAALVAAVVTLCSLTFCWIMATDNPHGRYAQVDFVNEGTLRIASNTLEVDLLILDEETGLYTVTDTVPILAGMVPNETIPFRLRFRNSSGATQRVAITLNNITATTPDLFDYMYVGMSGGEGYIGNLYSDLIVPDKVFYCFSDVKKENNRYSLQMYDTLFLPPTTEDGYVEINGYFWFHRDATTALSGEALTVGQIRVIL